MQHLVIRTGSRIRKRLGIIVAVAALIVAIVFLFRPNRWFGRPALELVALDANGLFQDSIALSRESADTTFKGAYGARARVPLVLGVRNVGDIEGAARTLELSLPARYRLETGDGKELPHQSEQGNPLVRYTINGPFPPVQPGRMPSVLPTVDTVWLEPVVPQLYCISVGDSVPEFIPAGEPNPAALSHVQVFYSFDGATSRGRQAGLLSVRVDPSLLERPPVEPPPVFPTRIQEPAWPLPPLGDLRRVGTTTAHCGPPESPMEVQSTTWQTEGGGRLIVLALGGKPRKYLFDLNRDSIVDLEMWDASGKGRFNAERAAHYPIPPFLLPPAPPPFNPAVFADLPGDSLSHLSVFRQAGSYRPTTAPQDSSAASNAFRGGSYSPRSPQPPESPQGKPLPGMTIYPNGAPAAAAAAAPTPAPAPAPIARPRAPTAAPRILGRPADSTAGGR